MAGKTRIIIAEDNPRDREYLLKTLLDYQLELTDTATKTLEIASEHSATTQTELTGLITRVGFENSPLSSGHSV